MPLQSARFPDPPEESRGIFQKWTGGGLLGGGVGNFCTTTVHLHGQAAFLRRNFHGFFPGGRGRIPGTVFETLTR